jgi:PBP1b-binding outer membrane lipoprotein LpoB
VINLKRIIYITGIILILSLLLSGCANRPQEDQNTGKTTKVIVTDQLDDLTTICPPSMNFITQEDLDKLKADIENLEAEDPAGLSND